MPQLDFHESYTRDEEVRGSSERGFGVVFGMVFLVVGAAPLLHQPPDALRVWALGTAAVFFTLAFLWTAPLRPLNRLWLRFGLMLHAVINPVVMGFLFYAVVTPTGLLMRALGKDVLRLKRDSGTESYWILREPPGPAPETMKNQF